MQAAFNQFDHKNTGLVATKDLGNVLRWTFLFFASDSRYIHDTLWGWVSISFVKMSPNLKQEVINTSIEHLWICHHRVLGINPTKEELQDLTIQIDPNVSGYLKLPDLLDMMSRWVSHSWMIWNCLIGSRRPVDGILDFWWPCKMVESEGSLLLI